MPRIARMDAPGALYHIMVRGIGYQRIFSDDQERDNFIEEPLGDIVTETKTFFVHLATRSGWLSSASGFARRW